MRIALAAEESAGVQALRLLAGSAHVVPLVLTGSSSTDRARGLTVAAVAEDLGVTTLPGAAVRDPGLADVLREHDVDVLLNVHSLHVVSQAVLAAPRVGCLNLHPGPLPGYAGLNAPNWALYHGETTHAVTLHWMAPGIDTGAVAYATTFPVSPDDTGFSLSAACVRRGMELVSRLLTALATDPADVPVLPQDPAGRRYFGRGVPHDGWIPWAEDAARVTGLVRACDYGPWASPWGRPRTRGVDGLEITVRRAQRTGTPATERPGTVGRCDGEQAWVATRDEWVVLSRIQVDNSPSPVDLVMSPGDVLGAPDPALR